jgi:hypothetical protein
VRETFIEEMYLVKFKESQKSLPEGSNTTAEFEGIKLNNQTGMEESSF